MDTEMHLLEHECNEAWEMLIMDGYLPVDIPGWITETAALDKN